VAGGAKTLSRAWTRIGVWAVAVTALGLLGSGLTARLAPTSLSVPGTPSARAHRMLEQEFGNSVPVTVLLQGPRGAVDRQGRRLVGALRRERGVMVMSPWDSPRGPLESLRPRPGATLIVVNFRRPDSEAMSVVVPTAQRIVRENVRAPIHAHVGGVAAVAVALQKNALEATHHAEMLVAPILILVLLLVFRTPVAAALPLMVGGATVVAGRGLLLLTTHLLPVNALAVAIASMMGLALGVDYALLMVSRFRQEVEAGSDDERAIATAARATGQTIVFAGGTLAFVMVAAALVAPGNLLLSVAAGVVVSAVLSVVLAISLLPALLRVLLPQLDRWRLPTINRGESLLGLAGRLIARPWLAIPLVMLPMLAIAGPAAALSMGPPDPRQLPASDPTREGFDALRRAIGPGWVAPFVVVATAREGSITDPGRLQAISRWQDRVSRDPEVAAVIGPASLAGAERPIDRLRRAYGSVPDRLAAAQRDIAALRGGLRRARGGVERLRRGLGAAADGAAAIGGGARRAGAGAGRLAAGIARAGAGARRLTRGLGRTERGAVRLLRGQGRLSRGAARLARGLGRLDDTLRGSLGRLREVANRLRTWSRWLRQLRVPTEMAADRLDLAMQEVNEISAGSGDPRYERLAQAVREASALVGAPAAPGSMGAGQGAALPVGAPRSLAEAIVGIEEQLARSVDSLAALPDRIERLSHGVGRLRSGADRVAAGAGPSERGGRALRAAHRRRAAGGRRLDRGLARARAGSDRLPAGMEELAAGAERLSGRLAEGRSRSAPLAAGLQRPEGPLGRYAVLLRGYGEDYTGLRRRSPRAIESGFLMLAALDGTVPGVREQISQVASLDGGAQAARMLIVPKAGPSAPSTVRLSHRLRDRLAALAAASGTRVGIGEGAQSLADYTDATMARIPWLVLALCLVSTLLLTAVLRSLLLPLVAVGLNLLTIAAAFGALQIFFGLGLLVGPRYIDAISAAGVLTIMFVLSIDYEVFLLTRMREAWLHSGDHQHAIEDGLRHTAGVISGAAVIMSSVFLVFATTDIASLQQFGAGLTFAVALDATVVRLILLPSIMRLIGPRCWWLPQWLDRRLPQIDHGGSPLPAEAAAAAESPIERLGRVSHAEHRQLLDLLAEIEIAGESRRPERMAALARELRALAEPHFRYEQQALFPQLTGTLGTEYVEGLYAAQEGVFATLSRIEGLAGGGPGPEAAAETRRLVSSARSSLITCDAAAELVERQPSEVADRVLAARERALDETAAA
jgi:RND superfamily putative drug exporter